MSVRVLIVDDEAPARAKLRRFVAAVPELDVVGEAASGTEALTKLAELSPDAVFLDVQMPGGTLAGRGFKRGAGCHQCHNSGYQGRIGVYELLEMDEPMIAALRRSDPQGFAEAAQRNPHYRPLAACALDYALAGVTSVEEVLKVCATLTDELPG